VSCRSGPRVSGGGSGVGCEMEVCIGGVRNIEYSDVSGPREA
jgi:hypothetical protein